jgi:hypothetical protein
MTSHFERQVPFLQFCYNSQQLNPLNDVTALDNGTNKNKFYRISMKELRNL